METRIFYGWRIVAVAVVLMTVAGGVSFFAFGVFVKPLEQEFGWSRTFILSAVGLWAVLFGAAGALAGTLINRVGVRTIIIGGLLFACSGLALLATAKSGPSYYASTILLGVGAAGTTFVPCQTLIANWFDRKTGRATGIMMLGFGMGGVIMPPLFNWLVVRQGWRRAVWVAAAFHAALLPLIALVIRTRPADLGLHPDGEVASDNAAADSAEASSAAVATGRTLWLVTGNNFFASYGNMLLTLNLIAFAGDTGHSTQTGANAIGVQMAVSMGLGVVVGWLTERHSPRALVAVGGALSAFAVVFLLAIGRMPSPSTGLFYGYGLVYGLGLASRVAYPVLIKQYFGARQFGKVFGLASAAMALGLIIAPPASALLHDLFKSYEVAFVTCVVGFVAVVVTILFARSPNR